MALILTRDTERFEVPDRLPVLPLRDVVVFPYVVMPLLIGRSQSLAAVDAASGDGNVVLLVAQRNADQQDPAAGDLYRIGVVARLMQVVRLPNGTTKILVEGIARARVTRYATASGTLRATITPEPFVDQPESDDPSALGRRVLSLFEEYVSLHRRIPAEVVTLVQATASEERQACAVAAHIGTTRRASDAARGADAQCPALSTRTAHRSRDRDPPSGTEDRRRRARLALS